MKEYDEVISKALFLAKVFLLWFMEITWEDKYCLKINIL